MINIPFLNSVDFSAPLLLWDEGGRRQRKKRLDIIHYSSDNSLKRMSYQINWVRKSFPSLGLESTAFLAHHFMFGNKNMRSKASECSHSRAIEKRGKRGTRSRCARGVLLPGPAVEESKR